MTQYLVEGRRFGNPEAHTYFVGIFDDLKKAIEIAENETNDRGGKYNCVVVELELNHLYEDGNPFEIYETDIPYHWIKNNNNFGNVLPRKVMPVFGKIRNR